jgi:hypothetical protein
MEGALVILILDFWEAPYRFGVWIFSEAVAAERDPTEGSILKLPR